MKVFFYINNVMPGGVQQRTIRLIRAIASASTGSEILLHLHIKVSSGSHIFDPIHGVDITCEDDSDRYRKQTLRSALKSFNADLVVGCFGQDVIRLMLMKVAVPNLIRRVVAIQAVPAKLPYQSNILNIARCLGIFFTYSNVDRIVCVSEDVKSSLSKISSTIAEKCTVIYNPVTSPKIISMSKLAALDPWEGMSGYRLISSGRIHKQKDYPTLLRAVKYLNDTLNVEASLVILGGGNQDSLQAYIKKLQMEGRVLLAGNFDNPFSIIARADLFVMSSLWEGLPSALIEALYLGVPCVSTDCQAGPAEILADGKYGRLVPVGDHVGMAMKIKEGLSSKHDKIELNRRGADFSEINSANNYINLFRDLISNQTN